jgi:hypothetical protein
MKKHPKLSDSPTSENLYDKFRGCNWVNSGYYPEKKSV